ncbi:hypothetical protein PO903_04270 [Paenibacillus sp. PK4536]|uniref:Uncharacterized protein n=1 Tax=Paenibacillus nuruki TaxID=1886670 RepID=A0A1E3LAV6_9BACL|nr:MULTISPECIES: hypothetical protein [Paenibacillus]ODP30305.1 hypothetical protein PTI45_00238 [Paenibacillus nuruki]WIM40112.1 hypothetical protein PO903_04270 [Paenibacillus sp. PK4536]
MGWLNPATVFSDPLFRLVWFIELLILLFVILTGSRFSRKSWIGTTILLVLGLSALLPGYIYQLTHPDRVGALIDIPLLLMFPIMLVSVLWAIIIWIYRWRIRQRSRVTQT